MQLWQAILLGVIYYLGNSYNFSFRFASYTPLCAGFLAGKQSLLCENLAVAVMTSGNDC